MALGGRTEEACVWVLQTTPDMSFSLVDPSLCPLTEINLSHESNSMLSPSSTSGWSEDLQKQNKKILRGIQCDSNFINLITRGMEKLRWRHGHSVGERAGT